jgi:hypothetical protein
MIMATTEIRAATASPALQLWSLLLPVLKCAVCPACLSLFGGLFAGARIGFLGSERFHGALLAVALLADLFILRAAAKHHRNRWPLVLCIVGGAVAVAGHFVAEEMEYAGFALLMAAAIQNVVLLRRHRHQGGACCEHDARTHATTPAHEHV